MPTLTLLDLWKAQSDFIENKTIEQIISMTGEGILKENGTTSIQFREYLGAINTRKLSTYVNQCLNASFKDSGLALQDLVNQFGKRLGFDVIDGLYRGRKNDIGFDGLWHTSGDHTFIIEVKTTDAYRINLNDLNNYKLKLEERGDIKKNKSSILIVVGRQDTGDLEAQIRGSKFAWSIRLVSVEAILRLIEIREKVNDTNTIKQINEILKPLEFTKLDRLIELIYLATEDDVDAYDYGLEQSSKEQVPLISQNTILKDKVPPKKFNFECIKKLEESFGINFHQQSKSTYHSIDKEIGLSCAVSKPYPKSNGDLYWFAFHMHQSDFLKLYKSSFVTFGCGSPENIVVIPFKIFENILPFLGTTTKTNGRIYWHVKFHNISGKFEIETPRNNKKNRMLVTEYLLSN